jgi:hypothetical protein
MCKGPLPRSDHGLKALRTPPAIEVKHTKPNIEVLRHYARILIPRNNL